MLTLFSFILVLLGALNWFCIGALQYDFVAGIFGSQASIVSRLIYFLVGLCGIYLVILTIKKKGQFKLTSKFIEDEDVLAMPRKRKNNIETDFEFKFNDESSPKQSESQIQTYKDFDESNLDI